MGAVFLRWDGGALGFSTGFFQSLTRRVSGVLCGLGVCLASLVFLLARPRSLFSPPLALAAAAILWWLLEWSGQFGFGPRSELGPAGKVRGCSLSASCLGKSQERKHSKPTRSICCEEGTDTRDSPDSHLLAQTAAWISCYFLFVFPESLCHFLPTTRQSTVVFLSFPGILGFCSGVHVSVGVRSDYSIFSIYLPSPMPCGHSVSKRLGFFSLSSISINFLLVERDCCNPFLRGNTHPRVFFC